MTKYVYRRATQNCRKGKIESFKKKVKTLLYLTVKNKVMYIKREIAVIL